MATIEQLGRLPGGEPGAVLRAESRARIGHGVTGPGTALWVQAEIVEEGDASEHAHALAKEYRALVVSVLERRNAWQIIDSVKQVSEPSALADLSGWASYLSTEQKRQILETPEVETRLTQLIEWTREYLAEVEVSDKIRDDVREGMDKSQREFLLRQQLAAIRKELGEGEPDGADDYRGRVEAATLPDNVREAALREVGKLERASDQSPESGLDPHLARHRAGTAVGRAHHRLHRRRARLGPCSTPITTAWTTSRTASPNTWPCAPGARHAGSRSSADAAPVRCWRSSARPGSARPRWVSRSPAPSDASSSASPSAASATRPRSAVTGGTYVGALPGRIVRAIGEAGAMNPVVLLDEIDKVGADYRGDPAAALLEVLDPAQNHTFRDHYLDLDLDLSDVLFIATANTLDTIPAALLDRMELVTLDGYTEDDKVVIARQHLLPRQLERAALDADDVVIDDEALRLIASDYTREAGVRQLERALGKVLRKVATKLAGNVESPLVDRRRPSCASTWAGPGSPRRRPSARRCPAWPPGSP